jgi:excinuclease ABC subunit A
MGPGAGDDGGRIVAEGAPGALVKAKGSRTAPYLAAFLDVRPEITASIGG